MMRTLPWMLNLLVTLSVTCSAYAATDTFLVNTFVDGDDTTPPTVPTLLTATPVATSQIDLSWASSTDDVWLTGYHVFRDNVQIATTTTTTYSDVGLTASTTYSYYVTAFDYKWNSSASSTVVSTTTLSITTPEETTGGPVYGSRRAPFELVRLEVIPGQESVAIRYDTKSHVRAVIRWGRTTSYELGSLAERSFSQHHETEIVGLMPGTMYYFTIEGEDQYARTGILTESRFTTLPPDDIFPPSNVSGLTLVREGSDIRLSWVNPLDVDFDHVRIVRNTQFFPNDTADGWVVYEDDGVSARDSDVAVPGARLFYTVFSYDKLGNISSGAVISIHIPADGTGTTTTEGPVDIGETTDNPIMLSLDDVVFIQDGVEIRAARGAVPVDGAKQLTILIPYDRLPEHLKTILVTLTSPLDPSLESQFLLRINATKDAYVAEIAPLGIRGAFPFRISIFDYTTTQLGYVSGSIMSEITSYEDTDDGLLVGMLRTLIAYKHITYLIWFIILLILITLLARRLMHAEE